MARRARVIGAVAGLMILAGCSAASPVVSARASPSASTRHPAGPPSGVLKSLEASRHVDPVQRLRCATANNGIIGKLPILATAETTFAAVRAAMNTQFGDSVSRHLPYAADEAVTLCMFKPSPTPTPQPGETNPAALVMAVAANGGTWWAGGEQAPTA